ncbi:50S ribosomal protein L24 [Candidatus Nomurabacteria bacterium]|nr:50S ribosomal protein L24 [Candidatus Nomurabacteria bacterium]
MTIKKGDNIIIIAGKEKGTTGTVEKVFPATGRIIVSGANKVTRHLKPKKRTEKGQTVQVEASLHASNVMLVDGKKRLRREKRAKK